MLQLHGDNGKGLDDEAGTAVLGPDWMVLNDEKSLTVEVMVYDTR